MTGTASHDRSFGPPPAGPAVRPQPEDGAEALAAATAEDEPAQETDRYEELWDPDTDTRPERIRRTRAKTRDARGRGTVALRGRRQNLA